MKNDEIENDRRESDPLYHLLFYPEQDGFATMLVEKAETVLKKRYGEKMRNDKQITETLAMMTGESFDDEDLEAKVFFMLCVFSYEPLFADHFARCYDTQGGYFEEAGPAMFYKTLTFLKQHVKEVLQSPYNITNIVRIIEGSILIIKQKYMMG